MAPPSIVRGPRERLAAWLYTGPPGHLYGVLADLAQLGARYALQRLRARLARAAR
ncbi:MAG: hypothetical protein IRZ21_04295 [Thermoleophilaceae bacterium]|nr:hypothetical protein [Thermoleophilaceae bacterium]